MKLVVYVSRKFGSFVYLLIEIQKMAGDVGVPKDTCNTRLSIKEHNTLEKLYGKHDETPVHNFSRLLKQTFLIILFCFV